MSLDDVVALRAILEGLPVGVVVVDDAGQVVFTSAAAAELVGADPVDGVGRNVFDLLHPDDRDFAAVAFTNTASRAGVAAPLRLRLAPPLDHQLVEVQANNLLADPAVGGIVFTLRAVDDEAQVLTAREASERRYQVMLDNISDAVTLIDAQRRVVALTGRQETLGYPLDYWTKNSARTLVHPDDVHLYDAFLVELRQSTGETVRTRYRIKHADGRWVTHAVDAVNLLGDDDVRAIVTTTRDVTAEVEAAAALAEAHQQAVDALAARDELVASVSHELRTPIHGILGLTELLSVAPLEAGEAELVSSIRGATESLRLVLDDLLDFSKIEAGRLQLLHEPFAPADVLRDLQVLFGPMASARGLDFVVDAVDELPSRVWGDPLRFRQVLHNLVGNAVKFTSAGEVRVRLAVQAPAGDGQPLVLAVDVADTGIGIAPGDLERVFEPFTEASAGRSGGIRGTGLGLAIARRLVALLGGTLRLTSELGEGSVFSFDMPVEPVGDELEVGALDVDHTGTGPGAIADPLVRARVLVVEDNPVNQLLVARQLERLGVDAEVVGDGLAALDVLRDETFDAVVLDWQLPGIDGFEVARRLRELEALTDRRRTPIVALTASAFADDERHVAAAGMDGFVAKPAGLAALRSALVAALVGSGTAPATPIASHQLDEAEDVPAVDAEALGALVAELDDDQLVTTVVATYLRELEPRRSALLAAAGVGAHDEVRRVAHTLGSSSALVGAVALAECCRRLEGSPEVGDDVVEQFDRLVDEVAGELPGAVTRALELRAQSSEASR